MLDKFKTIFETKAAMVGMFAVLAVLVVVIWGMVFFSGQSAGVPQKNLNSNPVKDLPVIKKQSKIEPKSVASYELYKFKDPFDPLVRASATQSGSGSGTSSSSTSAYDPKDDYSYTGTSTSSTSSSSNSPSNAAAQTCTQMIGLNGIVEVASEMYASVELRQTDCVVQDFTLIEGDVFATSFKVLDINDQGILVLYGDERFDLELNQSKEL